AAGGTAAPSGPGRSDGARRCLLRVSAGPRRARPRRLAGRGYFRPLASLVRKALRKRRVDALPGAAHIRPVSHATAATKMSPDATAPHAASEHPDAMDNTIDIARRVLRLEAQGISALADGLDGG